MTVQDPASPIITDEPARDSDRIASLDVLRGFALLGILLMNIQSFAMVDAAYMNPTAFGDLTGANYWVWYICHVLADHKMMTIFSMLFGAGIVLMTSRSEARTGHSAALHYRRMAVLLVIGLLHGYLLWYGDILYSYAMCGFVVYWFRRRSPTTLIVLGLISIAINSGLSVLMGWSMPYWGASQVDSFTRDYWQPTPEMIAKQIETYRGDWLGEIVHRVPGTFAMQTFVFLVFVAGQAAGLMLIGMALFKLKVFDASRSKNTYLAFILIAVLVGIPTIVYGVIRHFETGWAAQYSFFLGSQYNYWASILVSGGWIGVVMVACQSPSLAPLLRPLAAVGQMALSNYLLHTLICTTIFYGRGFGMYGQVSRLGQLGVVLLIWTLQLIISPLWLKRFRFGPVEWLWRSMTYLKWQPMARPSALIGPA